MFLYINICFRLKSTNKNKLKRNCTISHVYGDGDGLLKANDNLVVK